MFKFSFVLHLPPQDGKYEAAHPQSPWMMSLGRLCKLNEGNLLTKEKRKKEGIISPKLFICTKKLFQIHSQHTKIYQKNITTYPGALGVYSFTFTCSCLSLSHALPSHTQLGSLSLSLSLSPLSKSLCPSAAPQPSPSLLQALMILFI